jgi:hypothetical protein
MVVVPRVQGALGSRLVAGSAGGRQLHATIPPYVRGKGKYEYILSKKDLGEGLDTRGRPLHAACMQATGPMSNRSSMRTPFNFPFFLFSPLENGIGYLGSHDRLKVALDKLGRGETMKVTTIGGSITGGQGAVDAPSWPQYMNEFMLDNFGKVESELAGEHGLFCSSTYPLAHPVSGPPRPRIQTMQCSTGRWPAPSRRTCRCATTCTCRRMQTSFLSSTGELGRQ